VPRSVELESLDKRAAARSADAFEFQDARRAAAPQVWLVAVRKSKSLIRILVADDHAVVRAGLRMLVSSQRDMEVVAEAADGDEAARRALETRPDVVLLDMSMPGGSTTAIRRIHRRAPRARVLVLTMHDDPAHAEAAIRAGAAGYVVKSAAEGELLEAIRGVHRGRSVVTLSVRTRGGALVDEGIPSPPPGAVSEEGGRLALPRARAPLSPREHAVLRLVARGHTSREIAERLGVGVKTVDTYRSRLAEKLGVRSRAEIVQYALEAGLLAPGSNSAQE
jgi:two-component system response regulator NreC